MPRFAYIAAILFCCAIVCCAQEIKVRRDTQFPVELHTTVRSDKAKPGTKVEFRTTEAVLIGNNIVVPSNSKVLGSVEQVRSGAPTGPRYLLSIHIETLKWKDHEVYLNAVVASVEPTPAQKMLTARRHRFPWPDVEPQPFLKGVHIRAHYVRDAYTDFFSNDNNINLRSGIVFILRHVDPDHIPAMAGHRSALDVNPE
ncbi:MAG TPA: hypothetical protein VF135_07630 [Terriglobales bacterium]